MKIGITHGDPNGVGYDTIYKAFFETPLPEMHTFIVYGSPAMLEQAAAEAESPALEVNVVDNAQSARRGRLNIVDCLSNPALKREPGRRTAEGGTAALDALTRAVADLRDGEIDALVTCPVDKALVQEAIKPRPFTGHTDWLADELLNDEERASGMGPLMIMASEEKGLRVALATTHVALSDVSSTLTPELIADKLRAFNRSLQADFRIHSPRIAVLALNPHSGDDGLMGSEEADIIMPAIQAVRAEKINAFGPYSADGFWGAGSWAKFDGVLAMYHDQGLIPFKQLAMESGVNFTAGLPFVRTSPDHGTGFDIAGKALATPGSLRAAIYAACDIAANRSFHAEAYANPLVIHQLPDRKQRRGNQPAE